MLAALGSVPAVVLLFTCQVALCALCYKSDGDCDKLRGLTATVLSDKPVGTK